MKFISIVVFSVMAVLVNARNIRHYDLRDAPYLFLDFVRQYNRQYKDTADVVEHYAAFVTNLVEINRKNDAGTLAVFGINQFTDYTPAQFNEINGLRPIKPPSRNRGYPPRSRN